MQFFSDINFELLGLIGFKIGGEELLKNQIINSLSSPSWHLLNNITLKTVNGTTQIDHILVSRYGVFVIETKHYSGWLFGGATSKEWTQVIYGTKHRESKRCYIGQSLKECRKRWANGNGYKLAHQPKFRSAINSYGWDSFDSHILFFSDDRSILDQAEIEAISAAGGHRSSYVFNLAPGGRATVDRSEALEGFNLKTKEWRAFSNSVEAANYIGIKKSGNIRRVVNGENRSAGGWWFRLQGSTELPPEAWGLGSAKQKTKGVFAIRLIDNEVFTFHSISEAAKHIKTHTSNVTHAVKRATGGTCKGFFY